MVFEVHLGYDGLFVYSVRVDSKIAEGFCVVFDGELCQIRDTVIDCCIVGKEFATNNVNLWF
jgi:hypothetical protein